MMQKPETLLGQAALLALAAVPLIALAMLVEDRQVNGINLWIKPMKFHLSVALHLATLGVLVRLVALGGRWQGRALSGMAWAWTAVAIFELGYITLRAARGETSHFNLETPLAQIMYTLMGVGAVTLIAGALLVGILILRRPAAGIGPGLRWGAGLGLILGFIATLIVAGKMGGSGSPWIGSVPLDKGGVPVFGWSREVGDLRVSHFFATHLMQVLPAIGWLADRGTARPVRIVALASLIGVAVVAATFIQALSGQPLIPG